jgi:hypothetical protein
MGDDRESDEEAGEAEGGGMVSRNRATHVVEPPERGRVAILEGLVVVIVVTVW